MEEFHFKQIDLSKANLEEVMFNISLDFKYFFEAILGYRMERFHEEWFNMVENFDKVCIVAPRQHGKTTFVAAYFVWKMLLNHGLRFLVVSDALKQAMDILKMIKEMIATNKITKALIPSTREQSWSKTEIETTTDCRVVVKANNEKIRGGTYDFVYCDEAGEYKDKSIFYSVIIPTTIAKKGKLIVTGTPTSKRDLLSELARDGSGFVYKVYRAIKENGTPLWKWKYSKEELEKMRRTLPSMSWEREFMCNPVGDDATLFPYDLIEPAIDLDRGFEHTPDKLGRYYMGFDVALSTRKDADASVWVILKEVNDKLIIAYAERAIGMGFEEQVSKTIELYKKYNVRKLVVDKSSFGEIFWERFKQEDMHVVPYTFTYGGKGRNARTNLLMSLRNQFERRRIVIPKSSKDIKAYSFSETLIDELSSIYPKVNKAGEVIYASVGHDDTVIALGLAVQASTRAGIVSIEII